MTYLDIARLVHETNRAYCAILGDDSQLPWEAAPEWQRAAVVDGVFEAHNDPTLTPEKSHERWVEAKLADGWRFGWEKDAVAKTHPCLVPYQNLDPAQRRKDVLLIGIVHACRDQPIFLEGKTSRERELEGALRNLVELVEAPYEYGKDVEALTCDAANAARELVPELRKHPRQEPEIEPNYIHRLFGLTYASYLVLTRTILQSMPNDWQRRFSECIRELTEATRALPSRRHRVMTIDEKGRFTEDPYADYDRGRRILDFETGDNK